MLNLKRKVIKVAKDLRKRPRIEFHIPVTVMGMPEKAQIVDFSMSGFFIQMEGAEKLQKNQMVHLAVVFPTDKNSTMIKVNVVRVEKNGFGCTFVDMNPLLYERLEKAFNIFSATLPIE